MSQQRLERIKDIFAAALECEPDRRAEFVAAACGGDAELRREVESLLAFQDRAGGFIEEPALAVAAGMMASSEEFTRAGKRIGRYRIETLLGAGGMGEVYLAEDLALGREVALKLLPAHCTSDAERVQRLEREARAASALNHPNIVTV